MEILAALEAVDFVVEYDAPAPDVLLARLQADVVAEGGRDADPAFTDRSESGTAEPKIVHIPLEPGYSISRLLDRIKQLNA
jgi:bifunctional ADP-heptose synthase (sugar kinase/adenylyltransferase)